jgi:hypothetical protein
VPNAWSVPAIRCFAGRASFQLPGYARGCQTRTAPLLKDLRRIPKIGRNRLEIATNYLRLGKISTVSWGPNRLGLLIASRAAEGSEKVPSRDLPAGDEPPQRLASTVDCHSTVGRQGRADHFSRQRYVSTEAPGGTPSYPRRGLNVYGRLGRGWRDRPVVERPRAVFQRR